MAPFLQLYTFTHTVYGILYTFTHTVYNIIYTFTYTVYDILYTIYNYIQSNLPSSCNWH